MNFIFSALTVFAFVLCTLVFIYFLDYGRRLRKEEFIEIAIDFSKKFNTAFAQNGTFTRVGEAVATDAPASPDASGGTSGGGQNPPEVEG